MVPRHRQGTPAVSTPGLDDPAIRVEAVTKCYGGPEGQLRAVDDVSLTIERGAVVGILGPNGAGKTTLIKTMLGLVVPTSGAVRIHGVDVHDHPGRTYEHAGAMLEGARNVYWRLTPRENLDFFASLAGHAAGTVRPRQDELLDLFDLRAKSDVPVKELSRGMKQKVSLASTLSRGCSVLFLDEPTLGLDVESSIDLRHELTRLVRRESLTVILSSHDMQVIEELCDRVVILNEGEIIADDSVENLTGVFDTQAYEVTMDGPLPNDIREKIAATHRVEDWEETDEGTLRFMVVLADPATLYDLVETLAATDRVILSLDSIQPDLETAFLELTNRQRRARPPVRDSTGTDRHEDSPSRATGDVSTAQEVSDRDHD